MRRLQAHYFFKVLDLFLIVGPRDATYIVLKNIWPLNRELSDKNVFRHGAGV